MYGYRTNENSLMTNLNSISSSLSSIDTIGRRDRNHRNKQSIDNLLNSRSQSTTSTSLLWRTANGNNNANGKHQTHQHDIDRYSTTASLRNNGSRACPGSEIYYNGGSLKHRTCCCCPNSENALNFLLVPTLLLTILRQVFDFLGQIWLQIIVNFFTILILIVALFGIRQARLSYLATFICWSLFNTVWNLLIVCIHSKLRDVGLTEDFLSLYTGATSWWHTNGPGCLPYNISSIQPPISIIKPNMIAGCRLDYHLVEATQAALHACLAFFTSLFCCCFVLSLRRNPAYFMRKPKSDKPFRLNNLTNSKINHDPYPSHSGTSRLAQSNTASLRRANNKISSRSSQHSVSSVRSRRRNRHSSTDGALPTPRGSTSSTMQRSQKYGSISSRRSHKKQDTRRGDMSSLTYGTTGDGKAGGGSQRTRLSSLSSADYLPSYQPPHSSSANLLSSYGEISSIDSYNNNNHNGRSRKKGQYSGRTSKTAGAGNTNPTYVGSRSSIYSQNATNGVNNYDDLSYIYGNNSTKDHESIYGQASTSGTAGRSRTRSNNYQDETDGHYSGRNRQKISRPQQEVIAEAHETTVKSNYQLNGDSTMTRATLSNGEGFQSFSSGPSQQNLARHNNLKEVTEVNNNTIVATNYLSENYENIDNHINTNKGTFNPRNGSMNTFDSNRSRLFSNGFATKHNNNNGQQIYSNNNSIRRPIYANQISNGNSETPI